VPADVSRDRVEQRIVEEFARMPRGAVVSGWAALRLHRVNFCDGLDQRLEVLPVPVVLHPRCSTRPVGVAPHREVVPEEETTELYGVTCATPERALFDAMKWAGGMRAAVVVADMAFAVRVTSREAFGRYVDARRGARGASAVGRAAALAVDRSRPPQESRMRLVWVLDAGLPTPLCNWPVGEYDGPDHREIYRQADDVSKESDYRDVGLECFRIVGRDLDDVDLVVRRMRGAVIRAAQAGRPRRWSVPERPGPLLRSGQAVTTTRVPTEAKSHIRIASGVAWRMQPCDCGVPSWASVCSGRPSLVGMLWKPIAACGPWANRTKYCMTPESSTPTAQRDRE
jgi:hypothetical protein